MRKPALEQHLLSERDVQIIERYQRYLFDEAHLYGVGLGIVVPLGVGYAVGQVETGAMVALYGWFVGGIAAVNLIEPVVRKRVSRFRRYSEFQTAMATYEAAVKARAERELRLRKDFWLRLTGHMFERELAKLFEAHGYQAVCTPGSGDGGVDIILRRTGRTIVVQCKQTRLPVGVGAARELAACLTDFSAHEGILASTAGATSGVHRYFAGKPLRVMDLADIMQLQETAPETNLPGNKPETIAQVFKKTK